MTPWENIAARQMPYRTLDDATLNLYLFEPPERAQVPTPAIVFFFGGGWVGGTPEQFFPQCRYLASRGMVAASAEYRVRERQGTTPFECVADGKAAVRWLRAHVGELGLDPQRIAAGGGSAGGHVAACAGMVPGYEGPLIASEDDAAERVSSVPDALVLFNPAVDVSSGRLTDRFQGRGSELSPRAYVRSGLPPTIILHGEDDQVVPYAQVDEFCQVMRSADNDCQLVGFRGYGHGFFNYQRHGNIPFVETMRAMDRFLVAHGFLTGDPTI